MLFKVKDFPWPGLPAVIMQILSEGEAITLEKD